MSDFENITDDELLRLRQIRGGEYLSALRNERNLTQRTVAARLAISFQYLSEIEKAKKSPSDLLIRELAEIYELDIEGEVDLYHRYGRIPLPTMEELKEQESTHLVLAQLGQLVKTGKMTDEQRQEFYTEFDRMYRDFIARVLPSKEDGKL